MSSEFKRLAAELEVLAKAQPATEEDKVLAAAKEAGVDTDSVGEKPEGKDGADTDGDVEDNDDEDEVLGKSFQATGSDGRPVKAYDATDLIKSLDARINEVKTTVDVDNQNLSKSLNLMTDMLKAQSGQIETLQKAVVNMSKQGVGRRAVLTVTERPEPAMMKSTQPGMNPKDFMLKANAAFDAGRISGKELVVCDVSLRQGEALDSGLINKIFAA